MKDMQGAHNPKDPSLSLSTSGNDCQSTEHLGGEEGALLPPPMEVIHERRMSKLYTLSY